MEKFPKTFASTRFPPIFAAPISSSLSAIAIAKADDNIGQVAKAMKAKESRHGGIGRLSSPPVGGRKVVNTKK